MADQTQDPRAPGWRRDPLGRHFGRYWDGQEWTEHVISAEKVQSIDPLPEPPLFPETPPAPVRPVRPAQSQPVSYRGPAPTAPGYVPEPMRSKRDGGVKVWKIALGVVLGLFAFLIACSALIGAGLNEATKTKTAIIRIEAAPDLCWSGSIGDATREGCGPARFEVETTVGNLVSANAQKQDDGPGQLTVVAEIDGKEAGRNSTTAGYGLAQVTTDL